jgi:hypothetical protein
LLDFWPDRPIVGAIIPGEFGLCGTIVETGLKRAIISKGSVQQKADRQDEAGRERKNRISSEVAAFF